MKNVLAKLCLAVSVACMSGLTPYVWAQERPRPLSVETQKVRAANAAFRLGRLNLRRGQSADLAEALRNFGSAAAIYREIGNDPGLGCSLLGLGLVHARARRTSEATIAYRDGLAIFSSLRTGNLDESALSKLAFLYNELVDKRTPFEFDELQIARNPPGRDKNGDAIDTRFSQIDERRTLQFLNQPFTVHISAGEDPQRDTRFAGSGDPPDPVSFAPDVQAIWKLNGVESLDVATGVSMMEAWSDRNANVAVLFGKRAINRYQEIRRSLRDLRPRDARRYVNQLTDKYRHLADLLIGLGRLAEADEVMQMLKDEEFSQFVTRDPTEIARLKRRVRLTRAESALIDRYIQLAERGAAIGEQFRTLDDKKKQAAALTNEEEKQRKRLETEVADVNAAFRLFLEKELVSEIGAYNKEKLGHDLALDDKLDKWGGNAAFLYTVVTEKRYRVVLTAGGVQVDAKTDISAAELNKKIQAFRNALQDTRIDPRPLGKELYDILVLPIEKQITQARADTLVWSLDGTLRYVPLAALSPDGRSYFAERYRNVILTNRTRDQVTGARAEWRAVGFGVSEEQTVSYPSDPGRRVKIVALPGTKNELMAIVRDERVPDENGILVGRRFLDSEFTRDSMTGALAARDARGNASFSVVHIASHFDLGDNWANSFLYLGNGKLLSLEELSRSRDIDFAGADLVTLSACKTALVTMADGFEVESLADAIQAKRGKAVMATLWSVFDQSTVDFMTEFYRSRTADPSTTKASALQQAQLKLIKSRDFNHPYHWSGFVLIGNWR